MSTTTPRYSLFPNGTSHIDWVCRNCDRCWKGATPKTIGRNKNCSIETAIAVASITDGTLLHDGETSPKKAAKIAARLNWDGKSYLPYGDCPEREEKRPHRDRTPKQDKATPLML